MAKTGVGVRELKTNLSRYLRKVQKGETIQVALHGKIVAKISPESPKEEVTPKQLVTRGFAHWNGKRPKIEMPTVKPRGGLVSDLLLEDRQ